MGHHFPLTTAALHIKDGIQHFPQVHRSSSEPFGSWEIRLYLFPLQVTQVAGIGFALRVRYFGQAAH